MRSIRVGAVLLCLARCLCMQSAYVVKQIGRKLENVEPYRIFEGEGCTAYVYYEEREVAELHAPFPLLVQKLQQIHELRLKLNDKTYVIRPFESVFLHSGNEVTNLGQFQDLSLQNSNIIVANYCDGDYCNYLRSSATSTVMYVPSEGEGKIERLYGGRAGKHLLKVYSPELMMTRREVTLSYYVEYDGGADAREGSVFFTMSKDDECMRAVKRKKNGRIDVKKILESCEAEIFNRGDGPEERSESESGVPEKGGDEKAADGEARESVGLSRLHLQDNYDVDKGAGNSNDDGNREAFHSEL
jgi:hypothetical protein